MCLKCYVRLLRRLLQEQDAPPVPAGAGREPGSGYTLSQVRGLLGITQPPSHETA